MAAFAGKSRIFGGGSNDLSILNSFYSFPGTAGNIRYVFSGATGTGSGISPADAFTTVSAAVAACTADNGDVVVVLPGHSEATIGAAGVAIGVAGVSIVGLGKGRQRGKITYTTAVGASTDITAARCSIENLVFTMIGFDAVTAGINISAADVTIENCEIEFADATNQATLALLTTAAADRLTIKGCHIHGSANAGTAAALRIVGGDAIRILDNTIIGNFTTTLGGIDNATTACTNILIQGNNITNRTASASVAINAQAGTTGQIIRNNLSVLTGTAPIVAAGINAVGGNYYAAAAGVTAGTLL